jgi:hypothetical protein
MVLDDFHFFLPLVPSGASVVPKREVAAGDFVLCALVVPNRKKQSRSVSTPGGEQEHRAPGCLV